MCCKGSLTERGVAVSTARAGNVIGGGDFAADRIIPDCVRAVEKGEPIVIRNPRSTRPYQHVLEALGAYLLLAKTQYENHAVAGEYNIGPNDDDCVTTERLTQLFCNSWGDGAAYIARPERDAPHEAGFLKLDCSKIKNALGWRPTVSIADAVAKTVEWEKARLGGGDLCRATDNQIAVYFE